MRPTGESEGASAASRAQRLGDSGAHTKSVASSTESELMSVNAKVAANKGKMIESLLKSVTTVGLD